MNASSPRNVLVLDLETDDIQVLQSLLQSWQCSVVVARSPHQALAFAQYTFPYLVILAGNHQNWSQTFVDQLRLVLKVCHPTIVALTDCHAPSWAPQEAHPGLDGFLVKPLTNDVLSLLVQSSWIKQNCCYAS